jgi:hypothetical protein
MIQESPEEPSVPSEHQSRHVLENDGFGQHFLHAFTEDSEQGLPGISLPLPQSCSPESRETLAGRATYQQGEFSPPKASVPENLCA